MHGRLGLAQPAEDPLGQLVLPGGERAPVDHRLDVVQVAMRVLGRGVDPGVSGAEAAAADGLERQLAGQPQAGDGRLDRAGIDPGIDQGPQGHVAGDAAEAVEIADAHALPPRCGRDPRSNDLTSFYPSPYCRKPGMRTGAGRPAGFLQAHQSRRFSRAMPNGRHEPGGGAATCSRAGTAPR